jgi:hypothetical protein
MRSEIAHQRSEIKHACPDIKRVRAEFKHARSEVTHAHAELFAMTPFAVRKRNSPGKIIPSSFITLHSSFLKERRKNRNQLTIGYNYTTIIPV